ncbi:MAG: ATP-dependent DNA helicase RecG [Burkholderiales bacterium]|nr:MAG: ATP-dependent DNA helicase RecG [Burkholderiales bacterium]
MPSRPSPAAGGDRSSPAARRRAPAGVGDGADTGAHAVPKALARLGLKTDQDLLLHLPLRYLDLTRLTPIAELDAGIDAQVEGLIRRSEVSGRGRRTLICELDDGSARLTLRFFHFYPSQLAQLAAGKRVRAYGNVRGGLFGLEMVHPSVRPATPGRLPTALTPVYPAAAGIGQALLRRAIEGALARMHWPETIPEDVCARLGLMPIEQAIRLLHAPPPGVDAVAIEDRTHPAWQRIVFDELLAQQLSLRMARAQRDAMTSTVLGATTLAERLRATLPFQLTGAQRRAWREIASDLAQAHPMNRLLLGDVGSGKTVVAALAALVAIGSGRQVALMAPTEILAEQHFRKLTGWLQPLGARIAWLAGSLRESDKQRTRQAIAAGEADLAIGTHALIEDVVDFERLGLAIVDEQHRFGVAQRLALRGRTAGAHVPHQLMMSATPIPRTLAMTYYADLDVSVIDESPPGRLPVVTKLVSESRRAEVVARVRDAVATGRQAYWVCPLIEESEALQLKTATETFEALAGELAGLRVGLVHGRLGPQEKATVMQEFAAGRIQVLVATTVIEVGVDVPNASLMVIEHAERFGLAQLHQLRGRVGRGAAESVCVLLYRNPLSEGARERLRISYESGAGVEIARRDLQLRGPGEFLGARQSGEPLLRFAELERDAALVPAARELAAAMLAHHPRRVEAHLARWLAGRTEFLKA